MAIITGRKGSKEASNAPPALATTAFMPLATPDFAAFFTPSLATLAPIAVPCC